MEKLGWDKMPGHSRTLEGVVETFEQIQGEENPKSIHFGVNLIVRLWLTVSFKSPSITVEFSVQFNIGNKHVAALVARRTSAKRG